MILDQVIDALIERFTAAVTVPVLDGPPARATKVKDYVLVGSTGEDDDGATVRLAPSNLGPGNWRDETGEVVCSAWSWAGDTKLTSRRQSAAALASSCVESLQSDRTLGGLLLKPGVSTSEFRYRAQQSPQGAIARVTFAVFYAALDQ